MNQKCECQYVCIQERGAGRQNVSCFEELNGKLQWDHKGSKGEVGGKV